LKRLNHILSFDNFYIDGYGLFLFLLGLFHHWVLLLCLLYFFVMRKKIKFFFVIFCISLISILFFFLINQKIPYQIQGEVRVVDINSSQYNDTITLKYKNMKFNMKSPIGRYKQGDIIYIEADVKSYRNQTIPFGFNQKYYYLSKGVKGYLDVKEVTLIQSNHSIHHFREKLLLNINDINSSVYVKALIFGEKTFSSEQSEMFKDLGIMYLLTVSGIHVYMLFMMIDKVLFYLSVNQKTRHMIKIVTYLILLYLNLFSIGVLRLLIMYIFQIPNQKYQLMYSKLDLLLFTFLLMIITNIHLVFHQGFLITYLIMNFIYLMEFRYKGYDGYLKKLIITCIIFLVVLPFNRTVSLLMILCLPFLIGYVTGPLFLGSIATLFIKELDQVMIVLINVFEKAILLLSDKNISFHLPALSLHQIFIYFCIIVLIFRSKKIMELCSRTLFLFLFFIAIIFYRTSNTEVIFLDVGQGDSTVIKSNGCVIVIDAFQQVNSYLKNQGIYEIDYLILTHSDLDHTKDATSIINTMKVNQIVLSAYDNQYEEYTGEKLYVKSGDQIKCRDLSLNILGPIKPYASSNNNSIVIQTRINDLTFLFTGDIEKEAEFDLANSYQYHLKSDVLKISHHGSSTSSTSYFLDYVSPSISVISLGYENKFKFPDQKVLERLYRYQMIIYRTDIQGSIIYSPSKKKEKWGLVLPF
jgi:competence protein ComEC